MSLVTVIQTAHAAECWRGEHAFFHATVRSSAAPNNNADENEWSFGVCVPAGCPRDFVATALVPFWAGQALGTDWHVDWNLPIRHGPPPLGGLLPRVGFEDFLRPAEYLPAPFRDSEHRVSSQTRNEPRFVHGVLSFY